ncbi:MAG: GAF domain-containing protein [Acidobacteria bacterium]|nr:GAF domain-containing protein [Acidobacteriota bacterium]
MSTTLHTEQEIQDRVMRIFVVQAIAGVVTLLAVTFLRAEETERIYADLGDLGPLVVLSFFGFITMLGLFKFQLTRLVFVSMVISGCIAMFPILGPVLSSWIAVLAAMAARAVSSLSDRNLPGSAWFGIVNTLRLTGTYGIPVAGASLLFVVLGGTPPRVETTAAEAARIVLCGLVLILANNLLMEVVMVGYGYARDKRLRISVIDASIYFITLPYAVLMTFSIPTLGLAGFHALAFSALVINYVARRFADARYRTRHQLQRLVSLSNIGKTISLNFTTDELLETIFRECRKVVDVSLFSIALVDEATDELAFEIEYVNGVRRPKERIPMGVGLNDWVIRNGKTLRLASNQEERSIGVQSIEDGLQTESWLGVPMIARDRVVGVISIQSYRKDVFTEEDELLLTAIATQAAVALENANLYRDLEGLTYALEHRVQERTAELRETNLRLLAADRSKNQFLANMSHELRTPLNSVVGFADVLLEKARGLISDQRHGFVRNIRTAGEHLLTLINDILDLSKIEAGKMELHIDEFEVQHALAALERIMHSYAEQQGVKLEIDVEPDVPRLRLDEGRLRQILFNLVSNAVKFSHRGGTVTIRVARRSAIESRIRSDSIRIDVIDHGIGMEEGELRKIFEEFYQTEDGRRAQRGGTGLGLSLTRNFVELHHGAIDVQSRRGEGSTFTVHLPLEHPESSPADPRPSPASRPSEA